MHAYIYQAALFCEDCGKRTQLSLGREYAAIGLVPIPIDDSDQFPVGPLSNGGGEADSPAHCDACGLFLENPLTSDGMNYVRETIAASLLVARRPSEAVALTTWAPFYGIDY